MASADVTGRVPLRAGPLRPAAGVSLRPVERACLAVAALLVLSGLAHAVLLLVGDRPFEGPLSWRKPATFGLAFGLTLAAAVLVTAPLRLRPRTRSVLLAVLALDSVVEVGGITLQAWRDVPSHLNTETAFDSGVAFTLAFGGGVLVLVLGTLAVTALRGRVDGPPDLRAALRGGWALMLVGLATGAAMVARGEVLIREGHRAAAYDSMGFLKPAHALGLHAVVVLPALAWALRRTPLPEERRTRLVRYAVAGYAVVTAAVLLACVLAVL